MASFSPSPTRSPFMFVCLKPPLSPSAATTTTTSSSFPRARFLILTWT